MQSGDDPLDAAIAGVNIVEDDPEDRTVGYGGLPNEDGVVELDSCVMHGPTGRGGAVGALRNIRNPSQVARLVAFRTDHVLLVGEGALRFARAHGFEEQDLLTDASRKLWLDWKESLNDRDDWIGPEVYEEKLRTGSLPADEHGRGDWRQILDPHGDRVWGTINCNVLDPSGAIAGVTTTSGLAFKIPGRVGDSPILGAGLYVDNDVGACGSTGRGEENLQRLSSFLAVEFMRQGRSPVDAGLDVLRRVAEKCEDRLRDAQGRPDFGLKFYLLNREGAYAGVSMWSGAQFAVGDAERGARLEDCAYLYEREG
jgi:N4-(beta-N-acetylglucosaminyl)-L-asparaginase